MADAVGHAAAKVRLEQAFQLAQRFAALRRDVLARQRLVDPALDQAERGQHRAVGGAVAFGGVGSLRTAGLARAGAQEPIAHALRQIRPVVARDQRQRQIEPRGAPGASDHRAIDGIDPAFQRHIGKGIGKGLAVFPMDRRAPPGQQTGARQHEGAARNAADGAAAARQRAQPGADRRIIDLARIAAGKHEQPVHPDRIANARIGDDPRAARCLGRGAIGRYMPPNIKRAARQRVGRAKPLDQAGIAHQRKAGDQQQADADWRGGFGRHVFFGHDNTINGQASWPQAA